MRFIFYHAKWLYKAHYEFRNRPQRRSSWKVVLKEIIWKYACFLFRNFTTHVFSDFYTDGVPIICGTWYLKESIIVRAYRETTASGNNSNADLHHKCDTIKPAWTERQTTSEKLCFKLVLFVLEGIIAKGILFVWTMIVFRL